MRRIRLENAQPGMIIAKTIFTDEGKILLNTGVELKERYIQRLKELGIPAIYVRDEAGDFEIPDVVSEETRLRAIQALRNTVNEVKLGKELNLRSVTESVEAIVNEVLANRNLLVNLTDIRSYDNYTFGHSVNVCILGVVTGLSMNFSPNELKTLAMGGILHDIGKIRLPVEILNKPGRLTESEYAEVMKHPSYGFEILRGLPGLSLTVAHIAYQHHERINGTGYPRKLKGQEINNMAHIVAIADVYDAITADRIYQKGIAPAQAIKILKGLETYQFDPDFLANFIKNIALYPIGTEVRLSSGESGIVVDVNKHFPARPIVRVLYGPDGTLLPNYYEVDLMKNEQLSIIEYEPAQLETASSVLNE